MDTNASSTLLSKLSTEIDKSSNQSNFSETLSKIVKWIAEASSIIDKYGYSRPNVESEPTLKTDDATLSACSESDYTRSKTVKVDVCSIKSICDYGYTRPDTLKDRITHTNKGHTRSGMKRELSTPLETDETTSSTRNESDYTRSKIVRVDDCSIKSICDYGYTRPDTLKDRITHTNKGHTRSGMKRELSTPLETDETTSSTRNESDYTRSKIVRVDDCSAKSDSASGHSRPDTLNYKNTHTNTNKDYTRSSIKCELLALKKVDKNTHTNTNKDYTRSGIKCELLASKKVGKTTLSTRPSTPNGKQYKTCQKEPIKMVLKRITNRTNNEQEYTIKTDTVTTQTNKKINLNTSTALAQTMDTECNPPANGALLNKDLDKKERIEYYKSLEVESELFDLQSELPDFNTGKKPVNPKDISRLDKIITVNVETPEKYIELDREIDKCEQFINGQINIDKMTCNKNGKITMICDGENDKKLLMDYLNGKSYCPKEASIKDFTFAIFGIPKIRESGEILEELELRNGSLFNKSGYRINLRFPINKAKDALVFSCDLNMTLKINQKPFIHLGKKRYNLKHFIELVQCFRCSKFGHKTEQCKEKKPTCPNCAEEHQLKECKTNYKPKCGNCLSLGLGDPNHTSWDVRCPYRHKWIKKQKGYD